MVALVGYTNAGKSTLFNALTAAGVTESSQLFSTLDPVTRRLRLPSGRSVLLTDTVGFIQKLPPAVIAAFRATLEELQEADLVLHVVDITHPNAVEQGRVVEEVMRDLHLEQKPVVLVLNKEDLLAQPGDGGGRPALPEGVEALGRGVVVSAVTHSGLDGLLREIEAALERVVEVH